MEWQAVVFSLQILLLATGWVLFQKARAELSARAAETPILNEVKALQRNVKQLLSDMEQTSDAASARLESRCREAQDLLVALEQRMIEWDAQMQRPRSVPAAAARISEAPRQHSASPDPPAPQEIAAPFAVMQSVPSPREERRRSVYALADAGLFPKASLPGETGLSEGEIEMLAGPASAEDRAGSGFAGNWVLKIPGRQMGVLRTHKAGAVPDE